MWDRKELKANAKAAFKKNYWRCVLVALVLSILAGGTVGAANSGTSDQLNEILENITTSGDLAAVLAGLLIGSIAAIVIAVLIDMFITNPLVVGGSRFFIRNNSEEKVSAKVLFSTYSEGRFGKVFVTMFLKDLFMVLWSLLFVIPGVIKSYSYRMVPYILADNPEMSGTEVITMSREMMNGHKWRAFVLDLSFIGWYILSTITCGILGIFYVSPYVQATNAELYLALRK